MICLSMKDVTPPYSLISQRKVNIYQYFYIIIRPQGAIKPNNNGPPPPRRGSAIEFGGRKLCRIRYTSGRCNQYQRYIYTLKNHRGISNYNPHNAISVENRMGLL